jgi:hypothetical protein
MCFAAMGENYHLSLVLGMRTPLRALALAALVGSVALGACAKSTEPTTTAASATSEQTQPRESRPSPAEIACHLHSCAPPRYCNRDKGVCELLPCTDSRDCPYGYKCDFSRNVCQ